VSAFLGQLQINDSPHSLVGYVRSAWPTWDDVDNSGCDARDEALKLASVVTPTVASGCKVTTGSWVSAYDGVRTTDPSALDIDHVVPLANAYISGAWHWSTDERRFYANTQFDLWPVSATSNRSKGDDSPDEWRPPLRSVWCEYAQRWVDIKVKWHLTATSAERDALGQMLDTCPAGTVLRAGAVSQSPPSPGTAPASTASPTTAGTVYYANCTAVRAAGKAPLYRGQPGYRTGLDRDNDGVACE
jgi:hypothetical protein